MSVDAVNRKTQKKSMFQSIILFFSLILGNHIFCVPTQAADIPEIVERGKLIVGVKTDVRPLGFLDTQGNLQGLEIDIAKRLAEEILGNSKQILLQSVKNQDRLPLILDDKVDLVIAKMTVNSARSRLVEFSPYYYLDSTDIITNQANLKNLSDLQNQSIAILNGSDAIAIIRAALPTAKLVGVNSYQEAFNLLETGKIAGFAADNSVLTGWVQEFPNFHTLNINSPRNAIAVVMPKGQQYWGLRQTVNEAINRWQKSGWLQERAKYWGLPNYSEQLPKK